MGAKGSKDSSGMKKKAGEAEEEPQEQPTAKEPSPPVDEGTAQGQTSSTAALPEPEEPQRTDDHAQEPQTADMAKEDGDFVEAVVAKASEFGDNE